MAAASSRKPSISPDVHLRLFNTLTRAEEEFQPGPDNTVRMYTCGLTVYARGHIGNFRTFICVDVLRRTLRHLLGYNIRHVVNFTDVDDRTIAGAASAGMDLRSYTDQYIAMFHDDARALGLEAVEENPRATDPENIQAMARLIDQLKANGHTYESDGSIYFRISTLPAYGKLAHLDHEGMQDGARVDADNYDKENARDFVLWKATKPDEPTWHEVSPAGRPGWHLECSAMALRLLGESPIDIHTGGIDLIFPHHENEIAQSEGATGKQFSRFWMHVEYLLVDEQKMSKSLGNTYTVPDLIAKGIRPSAVRALLMSAHYRKQLNFTWTSIQQMEEALKRLTDCLARVDAVTCEGRHEAIAARVQQARDEFAAAILSDLNTAAAFAAMFDLVRAVNSAIDAGQFCRDDAALVREAFDKFDRVLGILSLRRTEEQQTLLPIAEIEQQIELRNAARRARNWPESDRIRDFLAAQGILLEDGPGGTRWKRK
jgi:cysteinyl-tRNA synthetase